VSHAISLYLQLEKHVEQWSIDEVAQWALKIDGIEQSDAEALLKQRVNGKALLNLDAISLERCGIPVGPASILAKEIEKLKGPQQVIPLPGSFVPREEDVWMYTPYITIEGADDYTGILIQSLTNKENKHLLLNLHAFQDKGTRKHLPVPGFPQGYENEFYILAGRKPPKKKPKTENTEGLNISISRLDIATNEQGVKTEKLVQLHSTVLCKEDIIHCTGDRDAIVLFDMPFPGTSVAPVSQEIARRERVHLYGFAIIDRKIGVQPFVIPGEVMAVHGNNINLSCPSSPGLSGGAVVRDDVGGVIGYLGGQSASDKSFFGSFGFTIGPLFEAIQEKDKKKKEALDVDLKDEEEDKE